MLFPQLRGYTPLRVGNQQFNINHQLALCAFALLTIVLVCWHVFGPALTTFTTAATAVVTTAPNLNFQATAAPDVVTKTKTTPSPLPKGNNNALHKDWSLTDKGKTESQGIQKWKKPSGLRKIVGLVFYGRPASVSILDCYLKRNLVSNGGLLDEVVFLARTEKTKDLDWLDDLVAGEPLYKREDVVTYGKSYASAYDICEDDVMYVKIDDDIVFFEDTTIPTIVRTRWEHPEYFLVSANIMNQPSLSWVHHHLGVIKPYLPEVLPPPEPSDTPSQPPKSELSPRDESHTNATAQPPPNSDQKVPTQSASQPQTSHNEPSASTSSTNTKAPSPSPSPPYPVHKVDWRASLLPPWKGPEDFNVTGDYEPHSIPHRWLPVLSAAPDASSYYGALDQTPIMATEYGAFTPALYHWTIGAQEHYSFLEHLETNELWRYKFHKWDYYYKRLGIQFIAIMGRDINLSKPLEEDDEAYFSEKMPARLRRHAIVDGRALAAHFSFAPQSKGMAKTDILDRYRSFAEENICVRKR